MNGENGRHGAVNGTPKLPRNRFVPATGRQSAGRVDLNQGGTAEPSVPGRIGSFFVGELAETRQHGNAETREPGWNLCAFRRCRATAIPSVGGNRK